MHINVFWCARYLFVRWNAYETITQPHLQTFPTPLGVIPSYIHMAVLSPRVHLLADLCLDVRKHCIMYLRFLRFLYFFYKYLIFFINGKIFLFVYFRAWKFFYRWNFSGKPLNTRNWKQVCFIYYHESYLSWKRLLFNKVC